MLAAAARALRDHPIVNSQVTDDGIALLPDVHVGLAVALDERPVVPVIRDADRLDLAELSAETTRLAEAARTGKLALADLEGGTFSVSALGMFGVDAFTPVINPPNAAILGVGRLRDDLVLGRRRGDDGEAADAQPDLGPPRARRCAGRRVLPDDRAPAGRSDDARLRGAAMSVEPKLAEPATAVPMIAAPTTEGIGAWPARWATLNPDGCAIRWEGSDITWRDLEARVAGAANALADMGVGRGDRVGCLMTNCPEFLVTVFAAVRLGALFVPLNTRLAPPELAYIAGDAGVSVVVSEGCVRATIAAAGIDRPRLMRETWPSGDGRSSPASPTQWEDDAFICYTSGTTGLPKGAVLTHRGVLFTSIDQMLAHGVSHADRMYAPLPLCFTGGLVNVAMTMAHTGGTLVLESQFEPGKALRQIEEERVTLFFAVPYLFDTMRQHPDWDRRDLSSMRVAKTGGAPVPEALLEAYAARGMLLTQGFGLTEGGGLSLNLSEHDVRRKLGSAGLPVFYGAAKIADDDGAAVPSGTIGELCVSGPQVMRAYWNNPAATADALRHGWLHTGDLAVQDDEGYFTIVDRKKDMVISGGLNVYPAEVEAVLVRDPGVLEVAVVGVPSDEVGRGGRRRGRRCRPTPRTACGRVVRISSPTTSGRSGSCSGPSHCRGRCRARF